MCVKVVKPLKVRLNATTYLIILISFGLGCFLGLSFSSDWCDKNCCRKLTMENSLAKEIGYTLKSHSAFLIVLIFSSPKNTNRRDAIRSTWLKTKQDKQTVHFFVIGTASLPTMRQNNLEEENHEHGDLILLPEVRDYYTGLSTKLLHSMIWLHNNADFKFILKVDDDSFAVLNVIYDKLEVMNIQQKLYWGFFDGRAHIKRHGQWTERNWFLCDTYLPYATGGGYILSADLVHFVANNAKDLQLYNNEDVSMGVWLSPLNVNRIHDPNFDTEYQSRGCFNSYVVTHKQSIEQMQEKYTNLNKKGQLCPFEFRKRLSYIYNWKVPPSLCCVRNNSNIP